MKKWWDSRLRAPDDVQTQRILDRMDVFLLEMQIVADRVVDRLAELDRKDDASTDRSD